MENNLFQTVKEDRTRKYLETCVGRFSLNDMSNFDLNEEMTDLVLRASERLAINQEVYLNNEHNLDEYFKKYHSFIYPAGIKDVGVFDELGKLNGVIMPLVTQMRSQSISFGVGLYPFKGGVFVCSVYCYDIEELDGNIVREKIFHSGYVVNDLEKIRIMSLLAVEKMMTELEDINYE